MRRGKEGVVTSGGQSARGLGLKNTRLRTDTMNESMTTKRKVAPAAPESESREGRCEWRVASVASASCDGVPGDDVAATTAGGGHAPSPREKHNGPPCKASRRECAMVHGGHPHTHRHELTCGRSCGCLGQALKKCMTCCVKSSAATPTWSMSCASLLLV